MAKYNKYIVCKRIECSTPLTKVPYCCELQEPHLSGGRGRSLLSCTSLHHVAGGSLADGVHGCYSEVIMRVGTEAADAVACRGDAIDLFVGVVGAFGAVLRAERAREREMF